MSISILDFEKPIAEVAEKIEALQLAAVDNPELLPQIDKLKTDCLAFKCFQKSLKIRDFSSLNLGQIFDFQKTPF